VEKVVLFLSDMKFCFFKQLASAIEEGTTSFVPGIHVIGDQIKSSIVPYLGKQIFPVQNSNIPSGRVRARTLSANHATTEAADRGNAQANR
jgi:hypothetical protein